MPQPKNQNATDKSLAESTKDVAEMTESAPISNSNEGPRFVHYFPFILEILRDRGGAAEPRDVYAALRSMEIVGDDEINRKTKGGQSSFENTVAWARFYLAKAGLISGEKRGVWTLTPEGRETHLDQASSLTLFKDVHSRFKVKGGADVDDEIDNDESAFDRYDLDTIMRDGCFLEDGELADAFERLKAKRNLILQGPPGTGKTWLAKRLGYALIGTKDREVSRKRLRSIQFHPSLLYEDFVRGWRPDGNGKLSLIDGLFLEAVKAAHDEPDRPLVVVIEEINRGNPAQIFGEMLTLLERDKRREDEAIELAYRHAEGERVFIPENLYVIGTMNIADRSLALVDLALRRRFAFVTLEPNLNDRWKAWCREQAKIDDALITLIQKLFAELNNEIAGDRSLGPQFRIGHSYVTPAKEDEIHDPGEWLRQIIETEIAPLLDEYWYDNPDRAKKLTRRLLEAL